MSKYSAISAAVIAAIASVSTASNAAAAPETTSPVTYHASVVGGSVITTLENGTFTLAPDSRTVTIRDTAARDLESLPLAATVDGAHLPIRPYISADGRQLTLVPDTTALLPHPAQPIASPIENQLAMNDLINSVSIGTSVGSLIGTAIGAVIGIGAGFALAGASCLALSIGCVVAALPIITLVGGVGALAGVVLGGGSTAAFALYEYLTTLNAAPGTSKYGEYAQGKPSTAPEVR
ncbi:MULTISPECIES: hypothetical protein [Nocardia]|uniref:hypothetical protein n=1 Tax=Nocardia TaxID=1817 RepID=UPI001C4FCAF0|nr:MULTISPECIES: hypothetical protein [Nocardia]